MYNVIGVKFRKNNKMYLFESDENIYKKGEKVIVETIRGVEICDVILENKNVEETKEPLKKIIRKATQEDINKSIENIKKEKEAYHIMNEKIAKYKLNMNLVDAELIFDESKLLFYFTSEERIDFRELVRELASIYRTRIELRQIGTRDEVKMLGECGVCGRALCCNTFANDFEPVSIKMAKEQGLALNPTKISGLCGRLMCCLKYEQEVYEEKVSRLPKVGAQVKTPDGKGVVVQVEILSERVKVRMGKSEDDFIYNVYKLEDISFTKKDKLNIQNNQ